MIVKDVLLAGETDPKVGLRTYVRENSPEIDLNRRRPAVVICPGGGYGMVSDREAEAVALEMVAKGYQAFVLTYSVAPAVFPKALVQLAKAVAHVRQQAVEYAVDPEKIVVAGFSAGGHLAASLGVFWQADFLQQKLEASSSLWQPNALLLAYPVISAKEFGHQDSFKNLLQERYEERLAYSLEDQVTSSVPPTFIWHTMEDGLVLVKNSFVFVEALQEHGVPVEFHAFMKGGHGLSLGTWETQSNGVYGIEKNIQSWPQLFATWLECLFTKEEEK
ncbi:alpha/beta hydrolase [Enterococcus diestrammenae]|uniref:BD-FAE-like domain-containing protein n=1 Tax=Enterococcus diestrammenae TaxID=1155073 RepID=A0ABV0F005_9ENTE|nr:alpha/beta hydrolase [Enterococcus diestrammenae]KAF1295887.1 acetylesterase [Enterococcus diestrammenae]